MVFFSVTKVWQNKANNCLDNKASYLLNFYVFTCNKMKFWVFVLMLIFFHRISINVHGTSPAAMTMTLQPSAPSGGRLKCQL